MFKGWEQLPFRPILSSGGQALLGDPEVEVSTISASFGHQSLDVSRLEAGDGVDQDIRPVGAFVLGFAIDEIDQRLRQADSDLLSRGV
jgi:hypothetical protein